MTPQEMHAEFNAAWQFLKARLPIRKDEQYLRQFADDIGEYERNHKNALGLRLIYAIWAYVGDTIKNGGTQ